MTTELEVEVFRAGDYGPKGVYDEEALESIARDYDPDALHEAPVTLDHQQSGPAFGWVSSLRRQGDRLLARLGHLSDDLLGLIRRGAYKKRSIELYRQYGETGRPYLRAVSFLGAAPPEVKGLTDPAFGEGSLTESICFAADGSLIEALEEDAPLALAASRHGEAIERFCETLRREGRLLPVWETLGIRSFMEQLASLQPVAFGEGEEAASLLEWFQKFLRALPASVPMQELAGEKPSGPEVQRWGESLPRLGRGIRLNEGSLGLHRRALELLGRDASLSYSEALRRIAG